MRIAVVVKQVPIFTELALDADGRLIRAGLPLELNPYCRRAVSQATELAAGAAGSSVTILTLGPPTAEDTLRESIAWALDRGVEADGLLVTDPAFAGSDTLATARALAAALRLTGPWDLVLTGRNSVDADTGQVPPELAELLDLPFLTGVRELRLEAGTVRARCEHDDGWVDAEVDLPAVLSCAERLIDPCKVDPAGRAAVPAERIRRLTAADLGPGAWGQAGSPTRVGEVRVQAVTREGIVLDGPVDEQVRKAIDVLVRRGALPTSDRLAGLPGLAGDDLERRAPLTGDGSASGGSPAGDGAGVPGPGNRHGSAVAVILESNRPHVAQELLSAAAELARSLDGHVVALAEAAEAHPARLGSWGADEVVALEPLPLQLLDGPPDPAGTMGAGRPQPASRPDDAGRPDHARLPDDAGRPRPTGRPERPLTPEDVARGVIAWAEETPPWAILAPSTAWGREVASRVAARLGAGLTGDAVGFDVENGRLVAWKPAFGGQVVAAITADTPVQMATVRPGMLPRRVTRPDGATLTRLGVTPRGRVRIRAATHDDDTNVLAEASVVVGVGIGLTPDDYPALQPLLDVLGAELGATRKVTDRGWLPRVRQIGITGRSIAPTLYVAIGLSGKFNHMVGVRSSGTILAINDTADVPVYAAADVGIVGDWREVVPALVAELRARLADAGY